jgi:hypothetical protein
MVRPSWNECVDESLKESIPEYPLYLIAGHPALPKHTRRSEVAAATKESALK